MLGLIADIPPLSPPARGLVLLHRSGRRRRQHFSLALTEVSRRVPPIVVQFYRVLVLPAELTLPGGAGPSAFPAWLKAALALARVGFTSDNLTTALRDRRLGRRRAAILFVPGCTRCALIIVMAWSTASIFGISDLPSRRNTAINASGSTKLMPPIYLCGCLLFFGVCFPLTLLMKPLSRILVRRAAGQPYAPR